MMPIFGLVLYATSRRPRLAVNAAGLSYATDLFSEDRTDIPWEDILSIGLLHKACLLSGDSAENIENMLLMRLREGVTPPLPSRVADGQLEKLGYHPIGTLGEFGADPVLLREAVHRFSPVRYHTNAELLDLDPRLIPLGQPGASP
ncbi:hypothetical protein AB0M87_06400 [Streptomyces sp. NPDC051320]|uniref:hypothetical protein n=1 Tax=Streptomyces sp. NPDC051320 TaxID=3154644 RepID=UPI00343C0828